MDGQRFDHLTRQLTGLLTRRRLGGLLAAVGLSSSLTLAPSSEAKKKKKGNKNKKKCKKGTIKCGKKCVNTKTNALHCGSCGQRCGDGRACVDGKCQTGCPGDQILCGALCVDANDNEDHCGRCNNPCNDPFTCVGGECACADGELCDGDCVDTDTDDEHCGSCGNACDPSERCQDGACTSSPCGPGERFCPGAGGFCIPEGIEHCCNDEDCGPRFGSDLRCNAEQRCVCISAEFGHQRCLPDAPHKCGRCCAGGLPLGSHCVFGGSRFGDDVCMTPTFDGCRCPEGLVACPSRDDYCSLDLDTDPRRCGPLCEDCTINDPATVCCNGSCTRGGSPGFNGRFGPCGGDCQDCPSGFWCCNKGNGTPDECIPATGFCPHP
jgi:hypothetical protein